MDLDIDNNHGILPVDVVYQALEYLLKQLQVIGHPINKKYP